MRFYSSIEYFAESAGLPFKLASSVRKSWKISSKDLDTYWVSMQANIGQSILSLDPVRQYYFRLNSLVIETLHFALNIFGSGHDFSIQEAYRNSRSFLYFFENI